MSKHWPRIIGAFLLFFTLPLSACLDRDIQQVLITVCYAKQPSDVVCQSGNVILFEKTNELSSKNQVRSLCQAIHRTILENTGHPPLIAIDQEGGRIQRLKNGFSSIPAAKHIQTKETAFFYGRQIGQELQDVGINFNLAPVLDVDSNPNNPVIADRSFSHDPHVVAELGLAMIDGLQTSKVLSTLKHFPGHGDTQSDSHVSLPVVHRSLEELGSCELIPFYALHSKTDAILTAHVLYPALDPHHPATLSQPILQGLLRDKWGYEGLIISDSMTMGAMLDGAETIEEAMEQVAEKSIQAFIAGCDLILLGRLEWGGFESNQKNDEEMIRIVLKRFKLAVDQGTIPRARLKESINRILKAKHDVS